MKRAAWLGRVVVAISAVVLAHACGGDEGGTAGPSGIGGGAGDASSGTGGGAADSGITLPDGGEVESLSVEPASAVIQVTNGSSTPAQFTAKAKLKDGTQTTVSVKWTYDRVDLGTVSPAGTLTAHGTKGGQGTVTAELGGLTATAQATVKLSLEANPGNLSSAEQSAFGSPTGGNSVTMLYPYDKTVFGRGLLPPELMWSGGAAGDKYKVTAVDSFVTLTAYVTADPPSRLLVDKAWWTQLTESSDGAAISVNVQRMEAGGTVHQPTTTSWKIAPGNLRGTIYYWAVNTGQIMRINPGAENPVQAFDPGPANQLGTPAPVSGYGGQDPPWDSTGSGKRCVACHTVSKDGSTLAALFSACETPGGCGRPWGIVDTASEQIQVISNYKPAPAIFSALTPNGSHLVYDRADFTMRMADPTAGVDMASALDSLSAVAHPQFSPDGKLLAYLTSIVGAYPVEFSRSNLSLLDADVTTAPYFSNPRVIANAAAASEEIAFPSFTPDSKWVVYQRGSYSRASFGPTPPFQTGFNDLFMVDASGLGQELKLAAANGEGVLGTKDLRRNYQPRVNPVAVGGYFWVVFVSPRDYGNRMQSSSDSTNENRKQLWVAAIDANPSPGKDPSHPAFLLPGQDLTTINMDAYWALEPCKQNGLECSEGYECCTGFCRDQGDGSFKCVPPPTNECSLVGEKCTTTADCCLPPGSAVECIGGICALPAPR